MARQSKFSGSFYQAEFDELNKQIEECFLSKLGPGDLPISKREGKLKAIISPHAGYMYSGPCAAHCYKEIAESKFSDVYMIIGPNHQGLKSSVSLEDFKTPLGFVKNHKDLSMKISDECGIKIDERSHLDEHSLEVQVPFLQYVSKENLERLRIVPITISQDIDIVDFSRKLKKVICDFEKNKKNCTIIISSDFTHYGRNFGYIPFSSDIQRRIKEMDLKIIDMIKKKDMNNFLKVMDETNATICGELPIMILMNLFDDYKAKLLIYYTSYEITGDEKNSVSYAAMSFK